MIAKLSGALFQRFALILNFVGALLLFCSFQATSSDFRLIRAPSPTSATESQYAICVNNYALLEKDFGHDIMSFGVRTCPNWESSKPAAIVTNEHSWLANIALLMIGLGFFLQIFGLPTENADTEQELRNKLKLLKLKKELAEHS